MNLVTTFPHVVREIENVWIPLSDGCRLACRIWLPVDAESHPVPAILEYIPYRKRDFTATRDEAAHRYFAGHGYAGVRVDLRGAGDSDGILEDEYAKQELEDAVKIIAWLASQPWCTGAVGMMGNSWGGFNALQVAALRPPALGAIVTCCSTDDRYADDMHYMGGCLLNDTMDWGTMFFAMLARAPDPKLVGDRWRSMWLERLNGLVEPISLWLGHQRRDAYWRHGSVCEDYSRITCPVLAVGGWLDGYSNAIPRMLENLRCPRNGIIGPWAHGYPHTAPPEPNIGFLQEALRWWDRWLKGLDNGADREPMLRAYMGRGVPAVPLYTTYPGQWIAEMEWPSQRLSIKRWFLADGRLASQPSPNLTLTTMSPVATGLTGGEWCPYGTGGHGPEFPGDQREDDGRSLCFDTPPLDHAIEILGAPVLTLRAAVDRPTALVAIRLCDVAPGGASTRASFAVFNLTHREGHDKVVPTKPGDKMTLRIRLNDIAYAFPAGHRIRLALSTAYWPMVWPSPELVTLALETAGCELALPIREADPLLDRLVEFEAPAQAAVAKPSILRLGAWQNSVERDVNSGHVRVSAIRDDGLICLPSSGLEVGSIVKEQTSIQEGNPLSANTEMSRTYFIGRGSWQTRIEANTQLTCSFAAFHVLARLRAYEGEEILFDRTWNNCIPRDGL